MLLKRLKLSMKNEYLFNESSETLKRSKISNSMVEDCICTRFGASYLGHYER